MNTNTNINDVIGVSGYTTQNALVNNMKQIILSYS